MAPGKRGNKLMENIFKNLNQQCSVDHATKHSQPDSTPLKSMGRLFEKSNVTSDGGKNALDKEALVVIGTQKAGLSKRIEAPNINHARENIGTIASSTKSPTLPATENPESASAENPQDASEEESTIIATQPKKRVRGMTMGKGIMKTFATSGNKMKINVDPSIGRPINGEESAKLSSQIGIVTRDVIPIPKRWKDVDEENSLKPGFDHLKLHMDINIDAPGVKQCLIERIKSSSRQKRYKLHKHYKAFATLEEAKKNKPASCPDTETWEALCEYFATSKFKQVSDTNSQNRKMLRAPHITGRTPFTIRAHEITREKNGEHCDKFEFYKLTHWTEKDGWSTDEAKDNWKLMLEKREQYDVEESEKTDDEIILEVLGHGSGYVKGKGYGPKPSSRRTSSCDAANPQLQKEHESQVKELNNEISSLKSELGQLGENFNRLVEFMAAQGIKF